MKISWPLVHKKPNENPWVSYAKQLIYKKNKCMNLVVVGEPGNGKSWGLLSYFHLIDPDFNLDEQLCFRGEKLLEFLDPDKGKMLKGKPFMFDESGIDLYNLNWRDDINTALNNFFQTGRSLNYIFGMTVPYMSFVSSPVRKLMTHKMIAEGWTKDNKSKFLGYKMEWNDDKKKFYHKKLHVYYPIEKFTMGTSNIHFPKPPMKLITEYERRKKIFQREVRQENKDNIEDRKRKQAHDFEKANLVKCHAVAKELGIQTETMLLWIKKKEINARQIGKMWFMTLKEREKLLNRDDSLGNSINTGNKLNMVNEPVG